MSEMCSAWHITNPATKAWDSSSQPPRECKIILTAGTTWSGFDGFVVVIGAQKFNKAATSDYSPGRVTYPTWGKGKSSSKVPFWGDRLVPRRVLVSYFKYLRMIQVYSPTSMASIFKRNNLQTWWQPPATSSRLFNKKTVIMSEQYLKKVTEHPLALTAGWLVLTASLEDSQFSWIDIHFKMIADGVNMFLCLPSNFLRDYKKWDHQYLSLIFG